MTTEHYYSYQPTDGHGLRHNPIGSIVGPRVIGWIGTRSMTGINNLAPYSFCSLFNYSPPVIIFSSVSVKDTIRNAIDTREFTWNLATIELAEKMNLSSTSQPIDEFTFTNLTPLQGSLTKAPIVYESPVSIECKVTQHFQLTDKQQNKLDTWVVIGEGVMVHIKKELIKDGIYNWQKVNTILRAGGRGDYITVSPQQAFEMFRPD